MFFVLLFNFYLFLLKKNIIIIIASKQTQRQCLIGFKSVKVIKTRILFFLAYNTVSYRCPYNILLFMYIYITIMSFKCIYLFFNMFYWCLFASYIALYIKILFVLN